MDKKDIVTNLNIAYQGAKTRKAIEKADKTLNETLAEIKSQSERASAEAARAAAEAEGKKLGRIERDDMLPLERAFRTGHFDDGEDTIYLMDTELPDALVDRLEKEPTGAGKYFKWDYSDEEGMLELTQTDAWLVAKGVSPERRKKRIARAKEAEADETKKARLREMDRLEQEAEAKQLATKAWWVTIIGGLALIFLYLKLVMPR